MMNQNTRPILQQIKFNADFVHCPDNVTQTHANALLHAEYYKPTSVQINPYKERSGYNKVLHSVNLLFWLVTVAVGCAIGYHFHRQLTIVQSNMEIYEKILRNLDPVNSQAINFESTSNTAGTDSAVKTNAQIFDMLVEDSESNSKLKSHQVQDKNELKLKTLGIIGTHLKGALPYMSVVNGGSKIGPWIQDNPATKNLTPNNYVLEDRSTTVNIIESGLYLIYAQIHYETKYRENNFAIYLQQHNSHTNQILSQCSAAGPSDNSPIPTDVTCFTSVVQFLNSNDRIFLQQYEMNRTIDLRRGQSYMGLIQLSNRQTANVLRTKLT